MPLSILFSQQTQEGVSCNYMPLDVYSDVQHKLGYYLFCNIILLSSGISFMNFPKGRKAYLYYNILLIS